MLYLNLRREHFTAILSGAKTKEYRQASPHWRRLLSRPCDRVLFRNGYAKSGPRAVYEVKRIERDYRRSMYVIHIGKRIE